MSGSRIDAGRNCDGGLIASTAWSSITASCGWRAGRHCTPPTRGALAGAVSLGLVDFDDKNLAKTSALNTALENYVFGETPDVTLADITFPPSSLLGAGSDACIRVDVFRNQRTSIKALPVRKLVWRHEPRC